MYLMANVTGKRFMKTLNIGECALEFQRLALLCVSSFGHMRVQSNDLD